jgi:hypothetical protein
VMRQLPLHFVFIGVPRNRTLTGQRAQFMRNALRSGEPRPLADGYFRCSQGNRLVNAPPVSSSKLAMRVQFLFLLLTTARCRFAT